MAQSLIPNFNVQVSNGTPLDINRISANNGISSLSAVEYPKDKILEAFRKGYIYPREGTSTIDDPTFLGFTIMFDFEGSKLFRGYNQVNRDGSLNGNLPTTECAFSYLNANGETGRMAYLKAFIDQLQYININKPFFWQSLEGIDSLWTDFNDFKKMPIASEWELIIQTLESIDLKVFGLMELYRKAVFDQDHTRQVVPSNLQRFNMTIYINETRTIRPPDYKIGSKSIEGDSNAYGKIDLLASLGLTNDVFGQFNFDNIMNRFKAQDQTGVPDQSLKAIQDLVNWLNKDESGVIVSYTGCKFDPVSGGGIFQSVTNNTIEMASNNIKIKAKSASIASVLAWYEEKIDSSSRSNNLRDNNLWNAVGNRTKNLLENAARDVFNTQKRNLKNQIGNLIRENVPGSLMGSLQELQRGNLIGALYGLTGLGSLPDVYPSETPPPTERTPNNLGGIYPQELGFQSDSTPNNIGDVYPSETVTPTSRVPNNLGEVHSEVDLRDEQDSELGTVYPDLQEQLNQLRLERIEEERALRGLDIYPDV